MSEKDQPTRTRALRGLGSLLVIGAMVAWFSQPMLRFVDPDWLAGSATLLAAGSAAVYLDLANEGWKKTTYLWMVMAIVGAGLLWWTWSQALGVTAMNDRRCAVIERDMLSAQPIRSDGPDLFQALGCRPRVDVPVNIPRLETPAPARAQPKS